MWSIRVHPARCEASGTDADEPASVAEPRDGPGRGQLGLIAAILAIESLYVITLVIAIPMGRAAVAVTVVLGFVLATAVGAWLQRIGPAAPADHDRPGAR